MSKIERERIIDQYGNKIYGYLLRFLSNREDAEDVLQSVFLSFCGQIDNIDPQKYEAYLFRSAHNQAINYKKRKKRFLLFGSVKESILSPAFKDSIPADEKNARIREALKRLKPQEMLAIELQFYQEKSYKEIAFIMGTSNRAVDSILVRAKRKLRKYLQDIPR